MDRTFIGNNFYNVLQDLGEDYTITTLTGEEWTGKISLVAKTASTYMLAEREYLMSGAATFPDVESQTTFRGCYFHRQVNPKRTYILVSTIPKDTIETVADVYAVECNTKVSLAYLEKETDKRGNTILVPKFYAEDIPVYWDSTLQKQQRSSDGNFDNTLLFMQIPAHFGIAQDHAVFRKVFQFNPKTQRQEVMTAQYRVESVDMATATIGGVDTPLTIISDDDIAYGVVDVQMSLDTRG